MKTQTLSTTIKFGENIQQKFSFKHLTHARASITFISIITICAVTSSCTKDNFSKIYPVGTKFNYAAGSLHDLMQQGAQPTNPFVIDSLSPNAYGGAMGYYVTSSNQMHYTMSDCDIKVIE